MRVSTGLETTRQSEGTTETAAVVPTTSRSTGVIAAQNRGRTGSLSTCNISVHQTATSIMTSLVSFTQQSARYSAPCQSWVLTIQSRLCNCVSTTATRPFLDWAC